MIYSYEEAYAASLEYFNNDELAAKVFIDKYALRDNDKNLLEKTPDSMHHRLAREFARIEKDKFKEPLSEEEIFGYLDHFKYIVPQGSPMYGIGNNYAIQSLGNCFSLGEHPYDSYGGILYADQMLVQLSKRRCGVGLCLDNIRPKGLPTKNAAITTDGIGVFIKRFGNSTREVAQNGRRGGSLQGLSVHHPEIETFINLKQDKTQVTGSNLSVIFTDEFMQALINNKSYQQRWPITNHKSQIEQTVESQKIWDSFINAAWTTAEPGALWVDTARKYSLSHNYGIKDKRFKDIVPNVCGEIWMGLDSCRLMLLNMFNYVDKPYTKNAILNIDKFAKHIEIAQRLIDDMVDLEIEKMQRILNKIDNDPEPNYIKESEKNMWIQYLEVTKLGRRVGLGLTAIGDTIAALNMKYGSSESINIINTIYKTLAVYSMLSSCNMAKELGPFPLYDKEIDKNNLFLQRLYEAHPALRDLHNKYGRRNISLTTMSPSGSVSILTQTSSGIEPVYLLEYTRKYKTHDSDKSDYTDQIGDNWKEYKVLHHGLKRWVDISKKTNIKESPYYLATASDIHWKDSIKIQSTAQYWLSHSISKTCNLPSDISKEIISQIFIEAWKQGCKGFTIYRNGCREGILLHESQKEMEFKRPKELPCDVHHISVHGQKYFVLIGLYNNKPIECFAGKNGTLDKEIKSGKIVKRKKNFYSFIATDSEEPDLSPITASMNEMERAISRLLSGLLRSNSSMDFIVRQLDKTGETEELTSFTRCLARVLRHYIKDNIEYGENCPDCQNILIRQDGCWKCIKCTYSKCN